MTKEVLMKSFYLFIASVFFIIFPSHAEWLVKKVHYEKSHADQSSIREGLRWADGGLVSILNRENLSSSKKINIRFLYVKAVTLEWKNDDQCSISEQVEDAYVVSGNVEYEYFYESGDSDLYRHILAPILTPPCFGKKVSVLDKRVKLN